MNVVAVVGLRWIARGARTGPASVTLWVLAWLAFFVPLAAAVARAVEPLSRSGRRLRLGAARVRPRSRLHLRLVPVGQQPVLLSVASCSSARRTSRRWAATRWAWLGASRWYAVAFVLAGIWIAAGINIVGLRIGKWLQNAGSLGVLDSGRPPDRLRRARVRAIRIGDAVHAAHDGAARRRARHDRPVVGDVLRVLGIRDHVAHRPGDP